VGPTCPIIGTLDLQANLSQMMVESCTALIGPRISSHFDQHDSGLEAARLLGRTLRGEVCPVMAASFPPLAIATPRQAVRSESLAEVFALAQEQRVYPLVLSNSVFLGFTQADVREMGASAIVVTEGDDTIAENFADDLALALWESRESWQAVSAEIPETPLTYHHRRQPMFPWEPTAEWGIRK
jgi:microcystin degradation protein MlrC